MGILDIKHISRKPINNSMFMLPLITFQLTNKLAERECKQSTTGPFTDRVRFQDRQTKLKQKKEN
jgi:hypothetical protein